MTEKKKGNQLNVLEEDKRKNELLLYVKYIQKLGSL